MKGFVMSWDAHIVIAVLWHHAGSAGERCSGLYCCLTPLVPGVAGQPPSPHPGHPKLCREDPLRKRSLECAGEAGKGAGDPAVPAVPNLGWGKG